MIQASSGASSRVVSRFVRLRSLLRKARFSRVKKRMLSSRKVCFGGLGVLRMRLALWLSSRLGRAMRLVLPGADFCLAMLSMMRCR